MKRYLLAVCLMLGISSLKAENYYLDLYHGQTVNTCTGSVLPTWLCTDAFGKFVYCNNESYQVTFYSGDPGRRLRISFLPLANAGYATSNAFQTEAGKDFLKIYDGPNTSGTLLANLSGSIAQPFYYTSNSGYLTFTFTSDASFSDYGWFAILGCEPDSCNNNPPSNDSCIYAPLICDIDGYCGNTSGWFTPDHYTQLANNYGGTFCGTIENNGWIKFIPTTTSAQLKITSFNCEEFSAGIQAMMFQSNDCGTYTKVSNCATQSGGSGEFFITNTVPLVVGGTYYLMVDGYAGNTCDYVVNAVSGVRVFNIVGPANLCLGSSAVLTLSGAEPGSSYLWSPASEIPGSLTDSVITVTPTTTTTYTCTVTSPGLCAVKQKTHTINVVPKAPVSVSIVTSANPSCRFATVTFTATPVKGGATPTYQWYVDGAPAGTNSATFSTSTLTTGTHSIYVVMTSSDSCITGSAVATSNTISQVVQNFPVSVAISANPNPHCPGQSVTFTATPTNGGTSPSYQWYLNNVAVGTNSPTYTTNASTGAVRVVLSSNRTCASGNPANSATINISTYSPPVATANFTLNTCADTNGYSAQLNATNPSPGTGAWTVVSGPGSVVAPASYSTTIKGLSVTGASTTVKWVATSANGCKDSTTLTITPPVGDKNIISMYSTHYCISCPVKEGSTYYYYDPNGKLVAKLTDISVGSAVSGTEICIYLDYNPSGPPSDSDINTVTDTLGYDQPYLPRHWTIDIPAGGDVQVTLYFTDDEAQALKDFAAGTPYQFSNTNSLTTIGYVNGDTVYRPPGSQGSYTIGPVFTTGNQTAPRNPWWGVTFTTSGFTSTHLHPKMPLIPPLPVELVSFVAMPYREHIQLNWYTASETNNQYFVVERGTDGESFTSIDTIDGAGNSTVYREYGCVDDNVLPATRYYYRLKQVDFDGTHEYSDVVSAVLEMFSALVVGEFTPNPSTQKAAIDVSAIKPVEVEFSLFSLGGRKMLHHLYSLQEGNNSFVFELDQLKPGIYFGVFSSVEGQVIRKLVKME